VTAPPRGARAARLALFALRQSAEHTTGIADWRKANGTKDHPVPVWASVPIATDPSKYDLSVLLAVRPDPEIPDARASGFIFPIPAKSGFPIFRNPGFRPNRDSNPGKSRFFCSGQNRDCTLCAMCRSAHQLSTIEFRPPMLNLKVNCTANAAY
jgi:hypothetical protein